MHRACPNGKIKHLTLGPSARRKEFRRSAVAVLAPPPSGRDTSRDACEGLPRDPSERPRGGQRPRYGPTAAASPRAVGRLAQPVARRDPRQSARAILHGPTSREARPVRRGVQLSAPPNQSRPSPVESLQQSARIAPATRLRGRPRYRRVAETATRLSSETFRVMLRSHAALHLLRHAPRAGRGGVAWSLHSR